MCRRVVCEGSVWESGEGNVWESECEGECVGEWCVGEWCVGEWCVRSVRESGV